MSIKADQRSVVTVECIVGFVHVKAALVKCTELSDLVGQFDVHA